MSSVLVVGSANADLVYQVNEFPKPGETISAENFQTLPGGKGANQASAVAKFGVDCAFCGCIGDDALGDFIESKLRTQGIHLDFLSRTNNPTGTAAITIDQTGENQIVISEGANGYVTTQQVDVALSKFGSEYTLCQLEVREKIVQFAADHSRKFVLNPAPFRTIPESILAKCYAITPNETEFKGLTGFDASNEVGLQNGSKKLINMGVENVVVTLGKRGCFWTNGIDSDFIETLSVIPVDTTGAGDVFNGIFVACLSMKMPMNSCLKYAVFGASLSTQKLGAFGSSPTKNKIERILHVV